MTTLMPEANKDLREIDKMLPTGVKVRIARPRADGTGRDLIADVSAEEIRPYGDIEGYVLNVLAPKYGRNRYLLWVLTDKGLELPRGDVSFAEEPKRDVGGQGARVPTDEVRRMADEMYEREQRARKDERERMQKELDEARARQGRGAETEDGRRLREQVENLQRRLDKAAQDDRERELQDRIRRLEEERDRVARLPLPAPPPPPVQREDQTVRFGEVFTRFAEALKPAAAPAQPASDPLLVRILERLDRDRQPSPIEQLLLQLLPNLINGGGGTSAAIEALRAEIRGRPSIEDELARLQKVRDLLKQSGSLAGGDNVTALMNRFLDKLPPFGDLVQHFKKRQAGGSAAAAPAGAGTARLPPGPGGTGTAAPPSPPAPAPQSEPRKLTIPLTIVPHLKKVEKAVDGAERIGALMEGVKHLYEQPGWKEFLTEQLRQALAEGEVGLKQFAAGFLDSFAEMGLLEAEAAKLAKEAVDAEAAELVRLLSQFGG